MGHDTELEVERREGTPASLESKNGQNLGSARPAYLSDAIEHILANLSEQLLLKDIAEAVHVDRRTLRLAFRRYCGQSVKEFIEQRRLESVHNELRKADARSTTVTAIVQCNGFSNHSRFATAYRRRFGEYPSETLRRR